jgi:hypothetical protein
VPDKSNGLTDTDYNDMFRLRKQHLPTTVTAPLRWSR